MKCRNHIFPQILKYYNRKLGDFATRLNWFNRQNSQRVSEDNNTIEVVFRKDTTCTIVDGNGIIPGIFFDFIMLRKF